MEIPGDFRKRFVDEIRFDVKKMREERDPRKKIYFFSGIHGEAQRIFNISFDPQLLFIHFVLNYAYQLLNGRVNTIVLGRDTLIEIPDGLFLKLCDYLEELAKNIENDEDTHLTLQKIASLAYISTGNGYYLYQKGILKI